LVLIEIRLIPNEALPLPLPRGSFQTHLNNLMKSSQTSSTEGPPKEIFAMSPQVPLSPSLPPLAPLLSERRTHVMSILNITPDSFSDGGQHSASNMSELGNTISTQLDAGATILDIGGQSSRPGAVSVTSEEEISRILPVVELIREITSKRNKGYGNPVAPDWKTSSVGEDLNNHVNVLSTGHGIIAQSSVPVAISIDTYRASVAEAAIQAGAHIINDVSGGTLDPDMLPTVAKLGCTYVLMHMRGTPSTMTGKEFTTYEGDLIQAIGNEMVARLQSAEAAGIRRWRIILDPGIGFAKTGEQNLEILRRFDELRNFEGLRGMPWLLGVSRKGFIGKITGVAKANERHWGTAAAVAASVQGGADIVRIHDVDEMVKVVKVADAIYRV
jgi:2-amino-4-hydroxy-6-hydroxymethyldihydropteridine diphosphokinase/dihydropteroate synthase